MCQQLEICNIRTMAPSGGKSVVQWHEYYILKHNLKKMIQNGLYQYKRLYHYLGSLVHQGQAEGSASNPKETLITQLYFLL